jgi:hypothetical protein
MPPCSASLVRLVDDLVVNRNANTAINGIDMSSVLMIAARI